MLARLGLAKVCFDGEFHSTAEGRLCCVDLHRLAPAVEDDDSRLQVSFFGLVPLVLTTLQVSRLLPVVRLFFFFCLHKGAVSVRVPAALRGSAAASPAAALGPTAQPRRAGPAPPPRD